MKAFGSRKVRDYGLAGVFLILSLSGRAHITEQLIRVPVWLIGRADTDIGALRSAGLANEGGIVVFGLLGAGLTLHRGVIVERG